MSARIRAEIADGKQRIEDLERQVADAKADTATAQRAVAVQTRYASRVQSVIRTLPPNEGDGFLTAMHKMIDASRDAILARGK